MPPTEPNPEPTPADSPKSKRGPAPKRNFKQTRDGGTVLCLICRERFPRITAQHLRSHGWTTAMWERRFGPIPAPQPPKSLATARRRLAQTRLQAVNSKLSRAQATLQLDAAIPVESATTGGDLAGVVAQQLLTDPTFAARLTDEVQDAIFAGPLRDRLRASLVGILAERLDMHGQATARLKRIHAELSQPWRLEAGGEGGTATPTKELVAMLGNALVEVRHGEDLVVKAVKLALDEQRTRVAAGQTEAPLDGARYSGKAEKLPVPEGISAGERETVRTLLGMLQKGVEARRALNASVVDAKVVSTPVVGRLPDAPGVPTPINGAPVSLVSATPTARPTTREEAAADF